MKCSSKFCNHDNPEDANYCGACGLNLKMDKEYVLFWDGLYAGFLSIKERNLKGFKPPKDAIEMNLREFRLMMERHPEFAYIIGLQEGLNSKNNKLDQNDTKDLEDVEFPKSGLYSIFLKRLKKIEIRPNKIIKFPEIFQTVCCNFKMTKEECWDVLFMLNEFGLIQIVPFNGIRLKY